VSPLLKTASGVQARVLDCQVVNQPGQRINGRDFREFAAGELTRWSDLVGAEVSHPEWGTGHIASVEQRPNYIPLIRIVFEHETLTFNSDSFRDGKASLLISASLTARMAAQKAAQAQEERERAEREARENAERQRERAEREARENAERQRRQELDRRKAQTLRTFGPLARKYRIPNEFLWRDDAISPLCAILDALEAGELPQTWEIEWLEHQELYEPLSIVYFHFYELKSDAWYWVRACKSLRQAHLPQEAVALSEGISSANIQNKTALSALWTTRGGALRDLHDLEAAKASAMNAMRESPDSYHPHNLMGAILYQEGNPAEGDKHFEEAIRLGATPSERDSQIRQSLRMSHDEARNRVIAYLLDKDPAKYEWVIEFVEKGFRGHHT